MPTFHSRFMYLSHLVPRFLGLIQFNIVWTRKRGTRCDKIWFNNGGPEQLPIELPHDRKEEKINNNNILKNSRYDYSPTQAWLMLRSKLMLHSYPHSVSYVWFVSPFSYIHTILSTSQTRIGVYYKASKLSKQIQTILGCIVCVYCCSPSFPHFVIFHSCWYQDIAPIYDFVPVYNTT